MPHGDLGTPPATYDPPITINSGGTYSGNWEGTGTDHAVVINTSAPVTIEDSYIKHRRGAGIYSTPGLNPDLTVRNTRFILNPPGGANQYPGRTVELREPKGLTFENNWIESGAGIYLEESQNFPLRIRYNRVRNIDGRIRNGSGGYSGRVLRQFFQAATCESMEDWEISWNEVINLAGQSYVEDNISFWRTSGISGDRITVDNNLIWGGFPLNPGDGYTGGGIMCGDGTDPGVTPTGYIRAFDNVVLGTVNYGIAIASGAHSEYYNNRCIGSARDHLGRTWSAANVGIYVWNYEPDPNWGDNSAYDNFVRWWDGSSRSGEFFLPDCSGLCSNTHGAPSGEVFYSDEEAEYDAWMNRVNAANINLGPQDGSGGGPTERTRIFSIDGLLSAPRTRQFSMDATLFHKEFSKLFEMDAFLVPSKKFSMDAFIFDPTAKTFNLDALLTNIQDIDIETLPPMSTWEVGELYA